MGWEGGGCDVHGLGRGGGWVYKELGGGGGKGVSLCLRCSSDVNLVACVSLNYMCGVYICFARVPRPGSGRCILQMHSPPVFSLCTHSLSGWLGMHSTTSA